MRLTNYMRDAFVSAAMQDVPYVDYAEQAGAYARNYLKGAFSKVFPGIDMNNASVKDWLDERSVKMPPEINNIYACAPGYCCLEDEPTVWAYLISLSSKKREQDAVRHTLEAKLRAVARSCNTRKQLVDALPEMEKYLPEDEPAAMRTLPVVTNVVADFVNAGWPKA